MIFHANILSAALADSLQPVFTSDSVSLFTFTLVSLRSVVRILCPHPYR